MTKLKYKTSKILSFHVVIKVRRNKRLTHINFYYLKNFLELQKRKSDTFQKYQLSYFLKNVKIEVYTSNIVIFHVGHQSNP